MRVILVATETNCKGDVRSSESKYEETSNEGIRIVTSLGLHWPD